MNGFGDHGLNEDDFGEKKGGIVQAFDAFPKAKPQYVTRTSGGGKWTVAMLAVCCLLGFSELSRWWVGYEEHTFAVEKGVGHILQINIDTVIPMLCQNLHINVQDAAGDRVLASQALHKNPTKWSDWVDAKGIHKLGKDQHGRAVTGAGWETHKHDEGFGEEHIHDIVAGAQRRAQWAKTPKLKGQPDSCRIYGSLEVNKVQGDFHITARGHGYNDFHDHPEHLDHKLFNFSHIVNELSFGPFYPSLVNPLDRTIETTENNFNRFQYFISVVPTMYTAPGSSYTSKRTIMTNQYAVTEQSQAVSERSVPGIFVKYDIEPILLFVEEQRDSFLRFFVTVVNILSGVLVAGHWGFTITDWVREVLGKRRKRQSDGVLNGRAYHDRDD